jgi:hypothetical protein
MGGCEEFAYGQRVDGERVRQCARGNRKSATQTLVTRGFINTRCLLSYDRTPIPRTDLDPE